MVKQKEISGVRVECVTSMYTQTVSRVTRSSFGGGERSGGGKSVNDLG